MCWVEKCIYVVPLDLGCILIGIMTFIFSAISSTISLIILFIEHKSPEEGFYYIYKLTNLNLNPSSIHILLTFIVITNLIWMLFSVNLVLGVKKNKPSLILMYFGFGVIAAIIYSLGGLLLLLNGHWIMALILYITILFYTHCLIVVHSVYDVLQSGKDFHEMLNEDSDDAFLIEPMDSDEIVTNTPNV